MVLVGTYTIIDGFFIGAVAGDDGLNSITIAWPVVAIVTAIGTGLGLGGAVIINSLRGENRIEDAEKAKKTTLILLFLVGAICSAVLTPLSPYIMDGINALMPSNSNIIEYAKNYSFVISVGSLFQIVGAGMVVLHRNEGKNMLSMIYTIAGLALHVGLDFLFVNVCDKSFILYGVAIATVAAQVLIMVLGLFTFRVKKGVGGYFTFGKKIGKASIAPIGLNFVPSAVLFFTTVFANNVEGGGVAAVAAYAVMMYAVYTYDYVFQGVVDGAQPIFSYAESAGDKALNKKTVKTVLIILSALSILFAVLTPLMIWLLPMAFGLSAEGKEMMFLGMIIYATSYPFKAGIKFICSYCYSCQKTLVSNIVTYLDPVAFTTLCLFLCSTWWGVNGVWIALPVSQVLVFGIGLALMLLLGKKKPKRQKKENK